MPRGRYSFHDTHDHTPLGEEHFHCATGPSGWRYTAQTTAPAGDHTGSIDLTIDDLGRPIRLELLSGSWQVRAAAVDGVTWVRTDPTGEHAQEGNAPAHAFTGVSPAFWIATARLLRLGPGGPATRVRLVSFQAPVLAPLTVDQAWSLLDRTAHTTDSGVLAVDNYRVDDLATGDRHDVHIAGDVVLAAPGVELEELDTPPSSFT
ncbi:hypothetical protein [Actinacidiphila yeochonensis]|uniref:hypothetical protein n=1 Tax=Actinacidiphila yeochonensis TaxID=89050 RepID=UPI00056057A6|nr:hypothetical protein [Actinacidiphila yeochonensis]